MLKQTKFTPTAYNTILEEILRIGYDKFTYNDNLTVLDNVYLLAEQYTHVYSKHKGNELGVYSTNDIYVDERRPEAQKTSTLIHELTHHLYYEIYEQWMMYALKVKKSIYIEAFVLFTLQFPLFKTFNEYIAHTTQSKFEKPGCQGYGSFIKLRKDYGLDLNKFKEHFAYGRAVSEDITMIIEQFLDEKVREKIVKQFEIDNIAVINQIEIEDLDIMSQKDTAASMGLILIDAMSEALKYEKSMEYLKSLEQLF